MSRTDPDWSADLDRPSPMRMAVHLFAAEVRRLEAVCALCTAKRSLLGTYYAKERARRQDLEQFLRQLSEDPDVPGWVRMLALAKLK